MLAYQFKDNLIYKLHPLTSMIFVVVCSGFNFFPSRLLIGTINTSGFGQRVI